MKLKSLPYLLLLLILLLSCNDPYQNPSQINLKVYDDVRRELSANQQEVYQSFPKGNPNSKLVHITLSDFENNKALINTYPKSYRLLKNKEASKITFLSSECIFAVLHRHEHLLKDNIEYIKTNSANNCSFNNVTASTVIKKTKLNNDWIYEIAEREID